MLYLYSYHTQAGLFFYGVDRLRQLLTLPEALLCLICWWWFDESGTWDFHLRLWIAQPVLHPLPAIYYFWTFLSLLWLLFNSRPKCSIHRARISFLLLVMVSVFHHVCSWFELVCATVNVLVKFHSFYANCVSLPNVRKSCCYVPFSLSYVFVFCPLLVPCIFLLRLGFFCFAVQVSMPGFSSVLSPCILH